VFSESYWFSHAGSAKSWLLLSAFAIIALWETFQPRKEPATPTGRRWANNAAVNFLLLAPLAVWLRLSGVVTALAVAHSRYGVLNHALIPFWMQCVAAVLLLDLLRYGQHYLYHALPPLWRVHQVHHSDPDFDWSTGFLFHPGEFLLSQAVYLGVIALLAPPAIAVLGLEVLLVAQNIFVHANVRLPLRIDRVLRRAIVTPDMHRVHHSGEFAEQNVNFGDVFPWWDFLFGTYLAQPAAGHECMEIGLPELGLKRGLNVGEILLLPFRTYSTSSPATGGLPRPARFSIRFAPATLARSERSRK